MVRERRERVDAGIGKFGSSYMSNSGAGAGYVPIPFCSISATFGLMFFFDIGCVQTVEFPSPCMNSQEIDLYYHQGSIKMMAL